MKIKETLMSLFFSRWFNPVSALILAVVFMTIGLQKEPGYWRDYWIGLSGVEIGFGFFWLIFPVRVLRISEEQKKFIEADMALAMIEARNKAEKAHGGPFLVIPLEKEVLPSDFMDNLPTSGKPN